MLNVTIVSKRANQKPLFVVNFFIIKSLNRVGRNFYSGSNGFTGLAFRFFFVVYINQMLIPRNTLHLQPTSYFRDKYTTFVNKNYKLRKLFSNLYESFFQPDDYRYNSIFRKNIILFL